MGILEDVLAVMNFGQTIEAYSKKWTFIQSIGNGFVLVVEEGQGLPAPTFVIKLPIKT